MTDPSPGPLSPPGQAVHVRVRLLKHHTHAEREHAPGDELEVVPPVAEWLRTHAIAMAAPKPAPAATPAAALAAAPAALPTKPA